MKRTIIAIGGSPSSGSTFLADLLDSLPYAVCGPELQLFSIRSYFTDFEEAKSKGFNRFRCPSCYSKGLRLNKLHLSSYGLDEPLTLRLLSEAESFQCFCNRVFAHFATFRGKGEIRVFCEKTPQNIHNARQFLELFPDSLFVHIVRNPIFVYKSLIRRGFPPYIAAATWLVEAAPAYELRKHPRLITIKYEDLVQEPFNVVINLVRELGEDFEEDQLQLLYQNNRYRAVHGGHVNTWEAACYGKVINANEKGIQHDDVKALNFMLNSRIGGAYARTFDLPLLAFRDVSQHFGYEFDELGDSDDSEMGWPDNRSRLKLLAKWFYDFISQQTDLSDLPRYLKPVVSV